MSNIVFKIIAFAALFVSFFSLTNFSFATSGCCSWHQGEAYCDYSTNRWVCNDGTYSPTCTCGGGFYQTPTCPLNSYWTGSQCSCYAGYISSGGSCISYQQYCWNTLGYSSTYNYGTGRCECMSGYVYSNGSCELGSTYCIKNYDSFSQYNYGTGECSCMSGYDWNSTSTRCISKDEICHNQVGIMSSYNSLNNTCDCFAGFSLIGGQCMPQPKRYNNINQNNTTTQETNGTTDTNSKVTSEETPTVIPTLTLTPLQLTAGANKNKYLSEMFISLFLGGVVGLAYFALRSPRKKANKRK